MKIVRLFFALTLLTGVIYPLTVTLISAMLFPKQSQGSLVTHQGRIIGSKLLAQKFTSEAYFHPRPSSSDYGTVPSAASQFSATSKKLQSLFQDRKALLPLAKEDLWSTSASGLDPDLSLESALAQVERVARSRGISPQELTKIVEVHTQGPTLGIWGRSRVNVLELNLAVLKGAHGNAGTTSQ